MVKPYTFTIFTIQSIKLNHMSKSKEMFQEEREKESQNLRDYLDDTYQEAQYSNEETKKVLNEIFETWAEIFSGKSRNNLKSKSSEGNNF